MEHPGIGEPNTTNFSCVPVVGSPEKLCLNTTAEAVSDIPHEGCMT